jgi:signal transduction histidine kinase
MRVEKSADAIVHEGQSSTGLWSPSPLTAAPARPKAARVATAEPQSTGTQAELPLHEVVARFRLQAAIEELERENRELREANQVLRDRNAVKDTAQRREAEEKVRDYQERLQEMAFDTALAEVRERRRIAVEVHDHLGQALSLVQIKLSSLRASVATQVRVTFDEAIALLARSIADTRTLIFELSPPVLYDLGLKEALAWLVEEIEKRQGLLVELVDDATDKPFDEAVAALVFRSIRELLTNVFKHARSGAATVSLRRAGDQVDIAVEDRGVGFDSGAIDVNSHGGGFGLFSIREQIRQLGGTVEIASVPSQGTRVSIHVPIKCPEMRKEHAPRNPR